MLTFAESKHPVFRSTSHCLEESLKAKGWKIVNTLLRRPGTIETVFRIIVSVNQLSIYGAVADMCEECDSCHDRTRRTI